MYVNVHIAASGRTHRLANKLHCLCTHLSWQRLQSAFQTFNLPDNPQNTCDSFKPSNTGQLHHQQTHTQSLALID